MRIVLGSSNIPIIPLLQGGGSSEGLGFREGLQSLGKYGKYIEGPMKTRGHENTATLFLEPCILIGHMGPEVGPKSRYKEKRESRDSE